MLQAKSPPSSKLSDPTRERLVDGLAQAIARRGYAQVTIADIVAQARVSKRTFYEHFKDRDECFLAAYSEGAELILDAIAQAVDPTAPWDQQIRSAVQAYLAGLEARPLLARTFLLEIQAAGPRALKARRKVHERFAAQIRGFVDEARRRDTTLRPLPAQLAAALVGGLNELVILHLESGATRFRELEPTATEFAFAVLLYATMRR
jgi:AcrR family transcriptional regulator